MMTHIKNASEARREELLRPVSFTIGEEESLYTF
jgi:hypothetical protein